MLSPGSSVCILPVDPITTAVRAVAWAAMDKASHSSNDVANFIILALIRWRRRARRALDKRADQPNGALNGLARVD